MFKKNKKSLEWISKYYLLKKKLNKCYKVYINNELKNVKAHKIRNQKELEYNVKGYKELNENTFYIYYLNSNRFFNSLNADIDIICCNKEMKILSLHKNVKKNKYSTFKFNVEYLWIVKKGVIDFYKLKNGDTISTMFIFFKKL